MYHHSVMFFMTIVVAAGCMCHITFGYCWKLRGMNRGWLLMV